MENNKINTKHINKKDNEEIEEEEEEGEYSEEEEAALLAGMPPGEMNRLEKIAFPGVIDEKGEDRHTNIRNYILVKWLRNTGRNIRVTKAIAGLKKSVLSDARRIFYFLQDFGYINFGICQKLPKRPSRKERIVVIGAGTAGIAAARQLRHHGFEVMVVEARDRIGGRVHTAECLGGPIDLGAMVVTGLEGNPLRVIAEQTNTEFHPIRENCVLFDSDGRRVPQQADHHIENLFNDFLDHVSRARTGFRSLGAALRRHTESHLIKSKQPEIDQRLFGWHLANLEYGCATHLDSVSLQHWDQDDEWELGGDHCLLPQGYQNLLSQMTQDIDIKFQCSVQTISHSADGVELKGQNLKPHLTTPSDEWMTQDSTGKFSIQASAALITIPLGVLKTDTIKFQPPLPSWKTSAISRMGYGLLNKVALRFPKCFWLKDDFFGYVNPDFNARGEFYLFWNMQNCMGKPILMALVAGTAAHRIEEKTESEVERKVMKVLTKIYGKSIPQPTGCCVTRWNSDPWARGSYSYISVDGDGRDYDLMARNINNRLFFAGEATCREHPATVAGAFLSGLREAGFISRIFPAQRGRKRPYSSHQTWSLGASKTECNDTEPPSKVFRTKSPKQDEEIRTNMNSVEEIMKQEPSQQKVSQNQVELVAPKAIIPSFPPTVEAPLVTRPREHSTVCCNVSHSYLYPTYYTINPMSSALPPEQPIPTTYYSQPQVHPTPTPPPPPSSSSSSSSSSAAASTLYYDPNNYYYYYYNNPPSTGFYCPPPYSSYTYPYPHSPFHSYFYSYSHHPSW